MRFGYVRVVEINSAESPNELILTQKNGKVPSRFFLLLPFLTCETNQPAFFLSGRKLRVIIATNVRDLIRRARWKCFLDDE